ncbi:hypothetical protein BGX30_001003 [Mortierella sp. GBA39]|nr:hypothetical protein BGX30_001003 [Mortierella sp. GBA39]
MSNVHQSFRQGPTGDLVCLEVYDEPETNQPVIYWDDITAVFPAVKHVKNGPAIVSFARNKQRQWCEPRCIRHYPGDVLQVVDVGPSNGDLQSPATPEPSTSNSTSTSSLSDMLPGPAFPALPAGPVQAIAPASLDSLVLHDTTTASASSPVTAVVAATSPTQNQVLKRAQTMLLSSSARLLDFETSARSGVIAKADAIVQGNLVIQQGIQGIQAELKENFPALRSEIARNTALQQELAIVQQKMLKLQERSIRMQQEALDRLALIQNKVAAIITQSYELHEYPIPRLFIVLPKESISMTEILGRGIKNLFADQFTLYFLCECGEHTKPVDGQPTNPNLKHEIHIARHEGYDIDRPTEFFDKYGSYILTLLQMLKYGVTIAGVVVPPLGHLNIVDAVEGTLGGINTVLQDLGPKVDSSIAYIEGLTGAQSHLVSSDSGSTSTGLGGLEALEGADLRQLESFLKSKDEGRVLGNLYRIVTSDGHVKWVCLDHYRENYRAKSTQDLRDAIQAAEGGEYDEAIGSVSVGFFTPIAARSFYSVLTYSRSVQCLNITLYWAPSMQDLRDLRDTIKSTNIVEITIRKIPRGTPLSDVFNRGRRLDPFLQMMSGGNIQSFRLWGWDEGFLECSDILPTTFTVRRLHIWREKNWLKSIPRLISILQASSLLSELTVEEFDIDKVAGLLLPALERAKLPRALKVAIGFEHGSYSFASFEIDAFTGMARPTYLQYDSDEHTELFYHPLLRQIRIILHHQGLTLLLHKLRICVKNNSGLQSIEVVSAQEDSIDWLQVFHRVFADYPQQTPRLIFMNNDDNLIVISTTSNIQDLSTTVIHKDGFNNDHLSLGYLGTIRGDWTFTFNILVLNPGTTPTDIAVLSEFLQKRPDRVNFSTLKLTLRASSTPAIVPALIKLIKESSAMKDTRFTLDLDYGDWVGLLTDASRHDAVQRLTSLNSYILECNLSQ